jgi:hypothetical protein
MVRLVRSLAVVTNQVPLDDFAVIGGLAVMVRLESAHRATDDLDTVASQHGDEPTAVDVVVAADPDALEGTKVDCIAVGDTPAVDLSPGDLPEDELDRAFILAHRWALDTADTIVVHAENDSTEATVSCRFASPASLVAMKLQSAPRRRAQRAHKAGGDLFDIFRLVSHPSLTRPMATALHHAPHDLGDWCATGIRRFLLDEAEKTAAVIARSGVAGTAPPTASQLVRSGILLLEWFERSA